MLLSALYNGLLHPYPCFFGIEGAIPCNRHVSVYESRTLTIISDATLKLSECKTFSVTACARASGRIEEKR